MNKLFVKDKIIPDYLFEDILYDLQNIPGRQSFVSSKDHVKELNTKKRNSISKNLKPYEFCDLNKILESFCSKLNNRHIASELIVRELEYVQYGISGYLNPHDDVLPNKNPKLLRRFTTVTLLSKTDDLQGGDLVIFDGNGNTVNTNLEVGETVLFYSSTVHQVTSITKGGREVLVAWIYDR